MSFAGGRRGWADGPDPSVSVESRGGFVNPPDGSGQERGTSVFGSESPRPSITDDSLIEERDSPLLGTLQSGRRLVGRTGTGRSFFRRGGPLGVFQCRGRCPSPRPGPYRGVSHPDAETRRSGGPSGDEVDRLHSPEPTMALGTVRPETESKDPRFWGSTTWSGCIDCSPLSIYLTVQRGTLWDDGDTFYYQLLSEIVVLSPPTRLPILFVSSDTIVSYTSRCSNFVFPFFW